MDGEFYFPGVTLLITHYNRSSSLERLLSTFRTLGCRFEDIVVSDDASNPIHQEKLKELQHLYKFRLIPGPVNKGFPANMNKGQEAVTTPLTMYVQEDFVPQPGCGPHLLEAMQFLNEDESLDYIRFWSFYRYPTLKPYGKGFSQTIFSPWNLSHLKFFMYSDNPHIRRSSFLNKFGRYQEDIKGDIAEYRMSVSYMQKKGKGLFYEDFDKLFVHENPPDEPSTQGRADWRQSRNPAFLLLRWLYLRYKWLKSTMDLKFLRT